MVGINTKVDARDGALTVLGIGVVFINTFSG